MEADWSGAAAGRSLSGLVGTRDPEPECAACWQVRDVVVTVDHSGGHSQPLRVPYRTEEEEIRAAVDVIFTHVLVCRLDFYVFLSKIMTKKLLISCCSSRIGQQGAVLSNR